MQTENNPKTFKAINPKKETVQVPQDTKPEMPYSRKAQFVKEIMDAYQKGFITTVECLSQISTLPWNPIEQIGIQKILDDSIRLDLSALEFHINQ